MEKQIAINILKQYFNDQSYLNITLNHTLEKNNLTQTQKGRVTILVYGTIQNLLFLQYQLDEFIKGKKVKKDIKILLLISLYEHYFMKTPDYAIVNESVKIAKKRGQRVGSFVNAVLRNAFKSEKELPEDPIERLSIETSHPLWMVKMFNKQYGFEHTSMICHADNKAPLSIGRVNTLLISKEEFLKQYPDFVSGNIECSVYYSKGNIALSEAYKKGYVTVQDESSQRVALYLNPAKNSRVLDMCGAPGSKTTHLAAIMENTGTIDVYDLYEHKQKLIEQNINRLHVENTTTHVGDATLIKDQPYDYILLDGPCSGLGVLARKPEIKYHDSSDLDEIASIQEKLLENAYILLKNSGRIVYSTCTLNKKENEKQVEAFLLKHPDMKKIKEQTILPFEYESDGFYMCLMEKE